jgi:hypothetical protein
MAITRLRTLRPSTDFETFNASYPDFVNGIDSLRKYRSRIYLQLAAMDRSAQRAHIRRVLRLPKLRMLYAYEGLKACRRLRNETPASIKQRAQNLCPFSPILEPMEIRAVQNRGRLRKIVCFGPNRSGRQRMISDLLRHLHPPLLNQYLFHGGMPKALNAIEEAVRVEGYRFGVEVDFVDFYDSVRLDGLADLLRPLPRAVVDNTVWDMTCRRDYVMADLSLSSWTSPTLDCHQGLAMGSACSPIVSEQIIAGLIASGTIGRVVAYADNMFIMGRTAEEVFACIQQLRERTLRFAGWQLRLRGPEFAEDVPDLNAGNIRFLRRIGARDGDLFSWAPDERKLDEYMLGDNHEQPLSLIEISELEEKVAQWRRAYPDWVEGDLHEAQFLGELAARRFYLAPSPFNRSAASHALIISYLAAGRQRQISELLPDGANSIERHRRVELEEATLQRLVTIANRGSWDRSQFLPRLNSES